MVEDETGELRQPLLIVLLLESHPLINLTLFYKVLKILLNGRELIFRQCRIET